MTLKSPTNDTFLVNSSRMMASQMLIDKTVGFGFLESSSSLFFLVFDKITPAQFLVFLPHEYKKTALRSDNYT